MSLSLELETQASPEDQLEATATEILTKSPYRELRDVSCTVHGERMILTGRVSSFYYKQLAQVLLQSRLSATVRLDNRLEVLN